jgi:outer membrane protein OmpA-like peptidoglycan-associated protein
MKAIVVAVGAALAVFAADAPGSKDHPLLTRYPGSSITWYDTQEHEPYKIATGPVTGYRKIDQWTEVSGKITRINYTLAGARGFYEVYANYLNALKRADFKILAEGFDKASSPQGRIGQRGFLTVHYAANPIPPGKSTLLQGSATAGGTGYFAAKLDRPGGAVYVAGGVAQYKQDEIVALIDIIEQRAMEDNLIAVDAAAMSAALEAQGRVALYGIFFDHDKDVVKPESRPALEQIAKLLSMRPALKLLVVVHTDSVGDLEYNIALSISRAKAVVGALARDHRVARERLEAHGVGPLAPAASNQSDAGRAKNRRVELVER